MSPQAVVFQGSPWECAGGVSLVKSNSALDPDLMRCSDGGSERLALDFFRGGLVFLSFLRHSVMELMME